MVHSSSPKTDKKGRYSSQFARERLLLVALFPCFFVRRWFCVVWREYSTSIDDELSNMQEAGDDLNSGGGRPMGRTIATVFLLERRHLRGRKRKWYFHAPFLA